jgi:hypothetical protein
LFWQPPSASRKREGSGPVIEDPSIALGPPMGRGTPTRPPPTVTLMYPLDLIIPMGNRVNCKNRQSPISAMSASLLSGVGDGGIGFCGICCFYYCSTYYKAVRGGGGGGGNNGGHVLRETTSRGLYGLVCPSRTCLCAWDGE